ncbi:hypothetical protein T492DRAFT_981637 [Pavlovales sp. CCMP2436]|nr:hypothetical protein T492DRAFT_981637 [Pavlovales sp. CCMP2436]
MRTQLAAAQRAADKAREEAARLRLELSSHVERRASVRGAGAISPLGVLQYRKLAADLAAASEQAHAARADRDRALSHLATAGGLIESARAERDAIATATVQANAARARALFGPPAAVALTQSARANRDSSMATSHRANSCASPTSTWGVDGRPHDGSGACAPAASPGKNCATLTSENVALATALMSVRTWRLVSRFDSPTKRRLDALGNAADRLDGIASNGQHSPAHASAGTPNTAGRSPGRSPRS